MLDGRAAWGARVLAAFLALGCLAVIVTASLLHPETRGHGTHTQLGLSQCGWVVGLGKPCPTCGMTTAFAFAADLNFWQAFKSQPAGTLLALLAAALFWIGFHVAVFGSALGALCLRALRPRLVWSALGLLLAAWIYKIGTWGE
jgi:hypothetical protein